jgi:hypothetical protein
MTFPHLQPYFELGVITIITMIIATFALRFIAGVFRLEEAIT